MTKVTFAFLKREVNTKVRTNLYRGMHWNSVSRHAVGLRNWDCTSAADLQAAASAADLFDSYRKLIFRVPIIHIGLYYRPICSEILCFHLHMQMTNGRMENVCTDV